MWSLYHLQDLPYLDLHVSSFGPYTTACTALIKAVFLMVPSGSDMLSIHLMLQLTMHPCGQQAQLRGIAFNTSLITSLKSSAFN